MVDARRGRQPTQQIKSTLNHTGLGCCPSLLEQRRLRQLFLERRFACFMTAEERGQHEERALPHIRIRAIKQQSEPYSR